MYTHFFIGYIYYSDAFLVFTFFINNVFWQTTDLPSYRSESGPLFHLRFTSGLGSLPLPMVVNIVLNISFASFTLCVLT